MLDQDGRAGYRKFLRHTESVFDHFADKSALADITRTGYTTYTVTPIQAMSGATLRPRHASGGSDYSDCPTGELNLPDTVGTGLPRV